MISNARELGIDLGDDVYKQTDALEEKIIKEEILPIIKEKIEPTLSQPGSWAAGDRYLACCP